MKTPLSQIRAILVQRDEGIAQLLERELLQRGVGQIVVARDAQSALEACEGPSELTDLAIVDWAVNDASGLEALRRIRDLESPRIDLPVVLLDSNPVPARLKQAIDAGTTSIASYRDGLDKLVEVMADAVDDERDFIVAPRYVGPDRRTLRKSSRTAEKCAEPTPITPLLGRAAGE